jgi:hypothetical protein
MCLIQNLFPPFHQFFTFQNMLQFFLFSTNQTNPCFHTTLKSLQPPYSDQPHIIPLLSFWYIFLCTLSQRFFSKEWYKCNSLLSLIFTSIFCCSVTTHLLLIILHASLSFSYPLLHVFPICPLLHMFPIPNCFSSFFCSSNQSFCLPSDWYLSSSLIEFCSSALHNLSI